MSRFEVPDGLVNEILDGRCVAFVGAGCSAKVAPGCRDFLHTIADHLGEGRCEDVKKVIASAKKAFDFDTAGQMLRDRFSRKGKGFEAAVAKALREEKEHQKEMAERLRWLNGIQFEAILTTNCDGVLHGEQPSPEVYDKILRESVLWRGRADWEKLNAEPGSKSQRIGY